MKLPTIRNKSMPTFDVSVVIPTHNRIAMLEEALESVFSQTYKGTVEIIVIDDNSQDSTLQIVREKYPDICLIALSQNGGPSAARNKGIAAAEGRYIAFLDSDDLWLPRYLETQIAALERNNSSLQKEFCISDIYVWEMNKDIRHKRSQRPYPEFSSALHHLLSAGSFIHTPSATVFPSCVFNDIGLFNEKLRLGEDTDFYIRLLLNGYQPIYTQVALSVRRKHSEQAICLKNLNSRIKNRFDMAEKYYPMLEDGHISVPIQKIYAEICSDFASYCYRQKSYLQWFSLSVRSARYVSWMNVLIRMNEDISSSIKAALKSTIKATLKIESVRN